MQNEKKRVYTPEAKAANVRAAKKAALNAEVRTNVSRMRDFVKGGTYYYDKPGNCLRAQFVVEEVHRNTEPPLDLDDIDDDVWDNLIVEFGEREPDNWLQIVDAKTNKKERLGVHRLIDGVYMRLYTRKGHKDTPIYRID